MLFPTTLVGSYPQPEWLIDREKLLKSLPPRVRDKELWRVPASRFSPRRRTMPRSRPSRRRRRPAWISSPTARSGARATPIASPQRWKAIDLDNPGIALGRSGRPNPVPRIVGPIRRRHPVEVDDVKFLRAHTAKPIKMTVPGPFTMSQQAQNDYYPDEEAVAMAYAAAVNEEIRDLFAAGADIVQVDEPYMQAQPEKARQYGLQALNRALEGISGPTAVHICFGYAAIVHQRPSGYSFLPELAGCSCRQVSVETAQANLDCSVLAKLRRQADHGRLPRPQRHDGRDPASGGCADQARPGLRRGGRRDPRSGLRNEVPPARSRASASCMRWSRQRGCCARNTAAENRLGQGARKPYFARMAWPAGERTKAMNASARLSLPKPLVAAIG